MNMAAEIDVMHVEPVPVTLSDHDLAVIQGSAEFTPVFSSWQTYTLQGVASESTQQIPILPADLRRRRAYIQVNSVPSPTTTQAEGSVTAPAANTNIVNISALALPPPGEYTVSWKLGLDGTPGAGEVDNAKLVFGNTLLTSSNDGAVGQYPQAPVNIVIPVGNANQLSVKSVSAGTAGAIYTATLTLTAVVQYNGFINIGQMNQVQNGGGGRIYAGQKWEVRGHSLLYFTGDGSTPLTVVVNVERDQEP